MTNHADSKDILIDQEKVENVTEFKCLGQTTHLKDTTKEEIYAGIRAAWSCFEKKKKKKNTRKYSKMDNWNDLQSGLWSPADRCLSIKDRSETRMPALAFPIPTVEDIHSAGRKWDSLVCLFLGWLPHVPAIC